MSSLVRPAHRASCLPCTCHTPTLLQPIEPVVWIEPIVWIQPPTTSRDGQDGLLMRFVHGGGGGGPTNQEESGRRRATDFNELAEVV